MLIGKRIGVALTGSFCTFDTAVDCMAKMQDDGASIVPIMSYAAYENDTKFGNAIKWIQKIESLTAKKIINTIPTTEPIGPGKMLDALVILPASGNTLAKIAMGIADTPASFAAKSQLRNGRPVILGVSSNDALAMGAKNIGLLLNCKNIYFIPFGQDDPTNKPTSMVFNKDFVLPAIYEALEGRQLQPILT